MAYTRVQAVPNIMIDYQSFVLFNHLSAEEKDIVSNAIMTYVSLARKRDAENVLPFLQADVSMMAREAFDGMIESIDEGFDGYWKMCEKLSNNRKKGEIQNELTSSRQVVDNSMTNSRQVVDIKKDVLIDGKIDGEINKTNISYPSYTTQILKSDMKDDFLAIIQLLINEHFEPTDKQCDDVANRMKFNGLNYDIAKHCVEVCKKRNKIGIGQFMAVFDKIINEGWDGQAI